MLNSAECPLQGAKCLECPLKKVRIESSQHFTRDVKVLCNAELQICHILTPCFCWGFFPLRRSVQCHFHLCSSEVKIAVEMRLCAALYHLIIPSGFIPTSTHWCEGAGSPPSCDGSETERGTSVLPKIFGLSEELGLNSGTFRCSWMLEHAAGTLGEPSAPSTRQTAPATHSLPAHALSCQWPASSIHQRTRRGVGGTSPEHIWDIPIFFTQWQTAGEGWSALKTQISKKGISLHLWHGTT